MNLTSRQRFIWGLVALSLLVSLALTLIFREQIRVALVMPISYAAWYVDVILSTVPQPVFWAILVFGGFFLSMRVLFKNSSAGETPPPQDFAGHSLSRYRYWYWYLSSFQFSQFSSEHMSRNLSRFVIDILAFQEHLSVEQVEDRVYSGELVLPDIITRLIKTRQLFSRQRSPSPLRRLIDRLLRRSPEPEPDQIDNREEREKLEQIIQFIEDRLEIQHEPN